MPTKHGMSLGAGAAGMGGHATGDGRAAAVDRGDHRPVGPAEVTGVPGRAEAMGVLGPAEVTGVPGRAEETGVSMPGRTEATGVLGPITELEPHLLALGELQPPVVHTKMSENTGDCPAPSAAANSANVAGSTPDHARTVESGDTPAGRPPHTCDAYPPSGPERFAAAAAPHDTVIAVQ